MNSETDDNIREMGNALDAAVAARDVAALQRAIETVRLSTPAQERPEVWLFADGLALLLVRGGIEAFLAAAASPIVESWSVFSVVNSRARRLTGEQLGRLVALAGVPPPNARRTELLREAIFRHPDPAVTAGLLAFIRENGGDGAFPAGGVRAQRPWRGKGEGMAVADAVAALGQRRGPEVPGAMIGLMRDIPWGDDPMSTAALLEGLLKYPDEACREAVTEMMGLHSEPGPLRLMLLAAQHTLAPDAAKHLLLADLRVPLSPEVHWEYLLLLRTWLADQKKAGRAISPQAVEEMGRLSPGEWPVLLRVTYLTILRAALPEHVGLAQASWRDRLLAAMVAGFERLRMSSRGQGWVIPGLLAGAIVFSTLLNMLLARPTNVSRGINGTLVVVWLFVMMVTARTQLTSEERPRRKLVYAMLFWGVTLLMVVSIVGTRIIARYGG